MGQATLRNDIPLHQPVIVTIAQGYESTVTEDIDHVKNLNLLVEGVHCAGCIQKIESRIARESHVKFVRLNFSTRRLTIQWNGDNLDANGFVDDITRLGYKVEPYNPSRERQSAEEEGKFLLMCIGVAGFAMGNIMLLSVGLWTSDIATMGMDTRDFMHLVSGLIAVPAMLFAGRPFFRSAFTALSNGHTNMDVPITVGVFLTGGMSLFQAYHHAEHAYFDSGVMLLFFLLIGRYFDFRARTNARSTATDLLSTFSGFANVLENNSIKRILIRDVQEDMLVRVGMGDKFPVDGTVTDGYSEVDTSLVTGETLPRKAGVGDSVFAGTLNLSAPVTMRVAKAAENSLLADIVRLMEKAGQGQAHYVRLADRAAKLYTPIVHTLAALAFFAWWLGVGETWEVSLMIATTVLIITCPCAMGLAVPVVQVLATSRLMKHKILVKSGDALERLSSIDTLLLDKTGTLTLGVPTLTSSPSMESLQLAASLAHSSSHPLSKAIVAAFQGEIIPIETVQEFAGQGLEGLYNGQIVRLGSRAFCGDKNAPPTDGLEIWLSVENTPPTIFTFSDVLRRDAKETVQAFQKMGMRVIILSGDRENVVGSLAKELGISEYYAQLTPPQKYAKLEDIKQQGHKILMIGDGLNDAPVLAGATVSMAPGSAIDMAQNAADIVFMGDALNPAFVCYKTALLSQKLVRENFVLAILYNAIAIPLALLGLVTPMIAAIAMSGSSLVVIANSFRLRIAK